jgi:hypothetical protein
MGGWRRTGTADRPTAAWHGMCTRRQRHLPNAREAQRKHERLTAAAPPTAQVGGVAPGAQGLPGQLPGPGAGSWREAAAGAGRALHQSTASRPCTPQAGAQQDGPQPAAGALVQGSGMTNRRPPQEPHPLVPRPTAPRPWGAGRQAGRQAGVRGCVGAWSPAAPEAHGHRPLLLLLLVVLLLLSACEHSRCRVAGRGGGGI